MNMDSLLKVSTVDKPINQLLLSLVDTSDKIDFLFLDTLGDWDTMARVMSQEISDQSSQTDMFLLEMLIILAVNILSFLFLFREMNKKILV